jgi:hypothetical protein
MPIQPSSTKAACGNKQISTVLLAAPVDDTFDRSATELRARHLRCVHLGAYGILQAVQKIRRRALCVRCGGEDRVFVVFQNLDP